MRLRYRIVVSSLTTDVHREELPMARAISVRLEETVYEETKVIAKRRGVSMNALIDSVLRHEIALEQEREMYEAATLLGKDADSNVDFAFAAQADVVDGD
jgi:predicted DNA-binding ribbon-helix-helix protein